jgi:Ca-activated chloride channel family protein
MQSFEFLRPAFLLLWPVTFGIRMLLSRLQARSEWEALIDPVLLKPMLQKPAPQGWLTPARLAQVMIAVWVLALSGPSWQEKPTPFADDKAPLVIALSLSSSMLADDLLPSRLARAKIKVTQLLESRRGSPTALVAFAETAHVVLPLTEDSGILKLYLDELAPDVMPTPGLNIEVALKKSAELLEQTGSRGSILLVTDQLNAGALYPLGEDSSVSLLLVGVSAASSAERLQVRAVEPVDRAGVQTFTRSHGIELVEMTADSRDVQQVQGHVIQNFESSNAAHQSQREDGGYYFVFPLLLLLLLWFRKGMVLQ